MGAIDKAWEAMKGKGKDVGDIMSQDLTDSDDWRYATVKEILTDPKHQQKEEWHGTPKSQRRLKGSSISRMKELLNESGATDAEGNSLSVNGEWDENLQYALSQYIRPQDLSTSISLESPTSLQDQRNLVKKYLKEKEGGNIQELEPARVPSNPPLFEGDTLGEKILNTSYLYSKGKEKGLPEGGQKSFGEDMKDLLSPPNERYKFHPEKGSYTDDLLETSFLYRKGQRDSAKK